MPSRQGLEARRFYLTLFSLSVTMASGCRPAQSSPTQALPSQTPAVAAPAPRAVAATPPELALATWNLEWLAQDDNSGPTPRSATAFARLGKYAQRLNADVIAVQEVESTAALARVFDPTRYAFHVTADATRQRTGFVYDKRLQVHVHPDYTAVNDGKLRSGADIGVFWNGKWVRLLSIHLKSGCFAKPLDRGDACTKLRAQVPKLEAWLDARAAEQTPFAVLGDFNRRLFAASDDPVWSALDDGVPPESDLTAPTQGQRSLCWHSQHPQFVDHIVLSRTLSTFLLPGSFEQQLYEATDARYRKQLSDHCPVSLRLRADASARPPSPRVAPSVAAPSSASKPTSTTPTNTAPPSAAPTNTAPTSTPKPPLLVKGNHSRKGERYYHTPACPHYAQVKIDTSKGERLFVDEAAARAAGYRRSPDCPK